MVAQSHPEGTPWNPDPTDGPQREAPGPPRLRTALPRCPRYSEGPAPRAPTAVRPGGSSCKSRLLAPRGARDSAPTPSGAASNSGLRSGPTATSQVGVCRVDWGLTNKTT